MLTYIGLGLAGGVLAFAHCLGMCGAFALHLSRAPSRWGALGRQLLWHTGKTFTYVFLGAMAGFVGRWAGSASAMPWVQKALAYATGAAMVLMGLAILGLRPRWRRTGTASSGSSAGAGEGLLASLFRQFFREPTPSGALVMGLATGFLPCPIVLGFLALSAQSGSVLTGMATMAAVGVGTLWSLLALGLGGHALTSRVRRRGAAVAGALLIFLGAATALRGTETFHHLLGCPRAPTVAGAADAPPRASGKDCCGSSDSK